MGGRSGRGGPQGGGQAQRLCRGQERPRGGQGRRPPTSCWWESGGLPVCVPVQAVGVHCLPGHCCLPRTQSLEATLEVGNQEDAVHGRQPKLRAGGQLSNESGECFSKWKILEVAGENTSPGVQPGLAGRQGAGRSLQRPGSHKRLQGGQGRGGLRPPRWGQRGQAPPHSPQVADVTCSHPHTHPGLGLDGLLSVLQVRCLNHSPAGAPRFSPRRPLLLKEPLQFSPRGGSVEGSFHT